MNNDVFQRLFDELQPALPKDWKKLILFVGYTTGSYTMKFYTSDDKDVFTDCFSQKGINKGSLIKLFMNIDKTLKAERNTLNGKDKWNVMTMIVDADGNMKTEYDYADISENAIAYERSWKEKYLK